MLANDTTPVNTVVFVFQQTQVHFVNAAIWNTKALIVKEVNNSLNQTISKQSPTIGFSSSVNENKNKNTSGGLKVQK